MAETLAKDTGTNKPQGKADLRADLDRLEAQLNDLKVLYEQYFSGILPLPPDQLHNQVKRQMRALLRAPFKNSALNYRLRTLEGRYHTFYTYWQRVLRQREDGTYVKDVFKAAMREKAALDEAKSETAQGAAQKQMQELYNSYRAALEKSSGKKQNIDFGAFQKSLVKRAKDFKEKHGVEKVAFKVVVKQGKVSLQLRGKSREGQPQEEKPQGG